MTERAHGIMFHHFHDEKIHPVSQGSISGEQFRKMIVWLKQNFNLLSAQEWQSRAEQQTLQKNDICITFDDNLLCQYEIALPVLDEFNIKAFWFVYSSPLAGIKERLEIYRYFRFVKFKSINDFYAAFNKTIDASEEKEEVQEKLKELDLNTFLSAYAFYTKEDKIFRYIRDNILGRDRYYNIMDAMIEASDLKTEEISKNLWNSAAQVKHLHDTGHVIGLHSHTHPTELRMMPPEEQRYEYETNRDLLQQLLGNTITSMSHPCNSYNTHTLEMLKDMNVNFGFRANMEEGFTSELEHPRIDHALLIDKI